ncbi:uracil-DNA glycosylase [Salinisphaera sp. Q1T1-3]|uniref:uracil-DNA glycosylase n=1 Tax=Salinisphaera sp. Q1T1-3 TaxID=2321229 RepID=UPI000E71CBA7|nr:uracil-DNA glycosylase [Salinisphaera sp. Q1T1-3]RJS95409.1 uracil-DNA glycosylase [Salinisphaera sp. Q1T1-3]
MPQRPPDVPAPNCRRCPRLAGLRRTIRRRHPAYHASPVAAVGPRDARLLVVGLAPGMHGANASGRPFSGDASGGLLFEALHRHGFANQAHSKGPGDGLALFDCRITNAVKCLPPENRPSAAEMTRCAPFLACELKTPIVVLALGRLAHQAVLRALDRRQSAHPFAHAAVHPLREGTLLLDSYHCSRYNLNTRRLTPGMFDAVIVQARHILSSSHPSAS